MHRPQRSAFAALISLLLTFGLASSLGAAVVAEVIRFEPPSPTNENTVAIHISASDDVLSCRAGATAEATVGGRTIIVTVPVTDCGGHSPTPDGWFHTVANVGPLEAGVYSITVNVGVSPQPVTIGSAVLPVRDAKPPFEVRPNSGSGWHDEVHLTAKGIAGCTATCADPVARFGDKVARLLKVTADEIVVEPPAEGPVDVVVERPMLPPLRAAAAYDGVMFGTIGDWNAHSAFFERVFFPLLFSGPGAFGSNWRTDVSAYNGNEYALLGGFQEMADPVYVPVPDAHGIYLWRQANGFPQGRLIGVPRQAAANANFGTLVRDTTRQAADLGNELPVVRERQMRSSAFSLLNVPTDDRYRLHLRLYGIDYVRRMNLRIETMVAPVTSLVDELVPLERVSDIIGRHIVTFASIDDLLVKYPQLRGRGPLRVQITPFGSLSWGFITVTNNETQHVTVISPQ